AILHHLSGSTINEQSTWRGVFSRESYDDVKLLAFAPGLAIPERPLSRDIRGDEHSHHHTIECAPHALRKTGSPSQADWKISSSIHIGFTETQHREDIVSRDTRLCADARFRRIYMSSRSGVKLPFWKTSRFVCVLNALVLCTGAMAFSQSINQSNWGTVTSPVYNHFESNPNYANAEILAGPNKFGSYYAGVLPNGKKVTPAGTSIQIGMNPLGIALTPDGKFLVSSNDDEREGGLTSYQSGINVGGYSLTVVDTASFGVVSQLHTTVKFFIGLQITGLANGPYTVWAAGGPDNDVKLFSLSGAGVLTPGTPANIVIPPSLPANQGFVSNYPPGPQMAQPTPMPPQVNRHAGAKITLPAGLQPSPDGKYLYVACNGDNSLAIIDTTTQTLLKQLPAGAFPYAVAVYAAGNQV